MELNNETNHKMRQLILNTKEPLLITDQIKCDLLSWNLEDWVKIIGDELLRFRCGKNQYTQEPQWESTCSVREADFKTFLKSTSSNPSEWWYFDYKYLCQWFTDKEIIKNKIDWSILGFPEINVDHSTIWIGSKGAYTPCHIDTYGCNIVLQLFGRKQWLLFPPEQNLKPTRIPFEESSIYSKLNFFSPQLEDFKSISHCHKVILQPGDILVVPNKWWHYVENLETAISVNAWIPLPQDDFERIKESIATIFVRKMTDNQNSKTQEIILNPNMAEEMVSIDEALNAIEICKSKFESPSKIKKTKQNPVLTNTVSENIDTEKFLNQCSGITKLSILNESEFKEFLRSQSGRFSNTAESSSSKNTVDDHKKIIDFLDVIINDEVLDLIAKKLIQKR